MKNLFFTLLFLTISLFSFAQSSRFDGYKGVILGPFYYTITEENESKTVRDKYDLENYLCERISQLGLPCYAEDRLPENFDNDYSKNQHSYLYLDVHHSGGSSEAVNASLTFHNCNMKVVYFTKNNSKSTYTTFRTSVLSALEHCISHLKKELRYYSYNESMSPKPIYPSANINNKICRAHLDSISLMSIEGIYKGLDSKYKLYIVRNDDFGYNVYYLGDKYYLWHEGDMKAKIEPTAINGLYSGIWIKRDKISTWDILVSYDNGILNVSSNEKENDDKYVKLYPNDKITLSPSVKKNPISPDKLKLSGTGSGFMIDNNGVIGTNYHVIKGARAIKVTFTDGVEQTEYDAKVLLSDKDNDVALVQITDTVMKYSSTPYAFKNNADVGEDVFTIGFPLTDSMGENFKVTNGIISAVTGVEDDVRTYQITVPVQPGNSGGALFNSKGYIVGITTSRLNEEYVKEKIENVNYAIKISYLLSLYHMLPKRVNITEIPDDIPELSDKVKEYKNYVCLIKVYR